jgi:hypothetical protein
VTVTSRRSGRPRHEAALQYEQRVGARAQFEVTAPFANGIGDVSLAWKQVLHADRAGGRIVSAGAEATLPTGEESAGLGGGVARVEPFVLAGQAIGSAGFVQAQAAIEWPVDRAKAALEGLARGVFGWSLLEDRGFGRAWTPMVEVLWARPEDEASEWDVVPQLQVTLSKLQHVSVAGGVRLPVTQRSARRPAVITYFLWDWFDGGLFDFWR